MAIAQLRDHRKWLIVTASFFAIAAAIGLMLFVSRPALAQDAAGDETKPCTSCHDVETHAWENSPHATMTDPVTGQVGATCEACHGEYVKGHPDEALAPLRVDSSVCKDCHETTYTQWQGSLHGKNDVQCISCHLPHSQQVRLTDEGQCKACHQESLTDTLHTAHWNSDAKCTDCHMANTMGSAEIAGSDPQLVALAVPNHDFVSVSADNCLTCHREDVKVESAPHSTQEIASQRALEELPSVTAKLESAQQNNRSLTILSLANLGFGMGIGGILAIVFVIVFDRYNRRRM